MLADAREGVNPYDGYIPETPEGQRLTVGSPEFASMERVGVDQLSKTCFAMVAGGMGERLGWPDIKISLPVETITNMCYMELYAKHIIAIQDYSAKRLDRSVRLPLVIMTSDDTHKRTVDLMTKNKYFGLEEEQVTILKQGKVPSLLNNDAHMTVSPNDKFKLDTKPHGHGDIHSLLHSAGLPEKWAGEGYSWLVFFQDTNSLSFRCVPAVIGVSEHHNFLMNSVAVARKPGEALGGICRLKKPGSSMTINVEYNQLAPLLMSTLGHGDIADSSGNSPYPGNCNMVVLHIPRYAKLLLNSGGVIPEFVNPKYSTDSKSSFKSPTRLECMMQDFPKLLSDSDDKVGFTELERWFCFSTVKNNTVDAATRAKNGIPPEAAFSGEADHFAAGAKMLKLAGECVGASPLSVPDPEPTVFADVQHSLGPRVLLMPSFGVTFEAVKHQLRKNQGKKLIIAKDSVLILDGAVDVSGLELHGALSAVAKQGENKEISDMTVSNEGWKLRELTSAEMNPPASDAAPCTKRLRGYEFICIQQQDV